ncbi:FAD-dependent monooxygenase [Croceibacterium sp. TMG7-5b_MA50]|uniref:NAD(P)/FAD-dependent oxidoreductase n=1 Tax=Croceibacterium sp. TMG7-5b_MA50 TaxID=3121290 RepID=UPI0032218508
MRRTPALIVGGGPAGASLALRLARAGAPHLLLERSRETGDALCGGFLSWRTLAMLDRLGIAADALNPQPVTHVRLFAGGRMAEAALPQPGRGVSRRHLDTLLLHAAEQAGAGVERGITVRAIDGLTARLGDGAELAADALFLASGKHDVRGAMRPEAARGGDPTLGLRVRLEAAPAMQRSVGAAVELHLFDRGYAGLVVQEDGTGNLCLAVHRSRLTEAGGADGLLGAWAMESAPFAERLAWRMAGVPDAVANVPYGWRATRTGPGLFRLGDQAAVIPSLAGEGMAIAIASAEAAASAYTGGGPAAAIRHQQDFARRAHRPVGVARTAWQVAERPAAARIGVTLARGFPALLPLIARLTRI